MERNPNLLELRHLQTLRALSEAGTLSKAARRLFLSQSALSHQIKLLEEYYEASLFERKSQPLRWTPIGQRLVALAYEVERLMRSAQQDIARIREGDVGQLRIAVECHSCFDWLMPSMDTFRAAWPEVEQDLVSGFHADPVGLLEENRADLVIVSSLQKRPGLTFHPLFRYEVLALLSTDHPLLSKRHLVAADFAEETLITYPIPDDRLDLVREVLQPAGIDPPRRTVQLTVAILQLVASQRGIAALPRWAVQNYLDKNYVAARPLNRRGLYSNLYAATHRSAGESAYMRDFIQTMREVSFSSLEGIQPLE